MKFTQFKKLLCFVFLVAPIACFAWTPVYEQKFTSVCHFGDSWTDPGNMVSIFSPYKDLESPPFYQNHFTDGQNIPEIVSHRYGLPLVGYHVEQSRKGSSNGRNFAIQTARINMGWQGRGDSLGLRGQIRIFTDLVANRNVTDCLGDKGLIIIMAGTNDLRDIVYNLTSDSAAKVDETARQMAQDIINPLIAIGAKNIIVSNVPNLALTPETLELIPWYDESREMVEDLVVRYNEQLGLGLSAYATNDDVNIYNYDLYSDFNQYVANSAKIGVNTTQGCVRWSDNMSAGYDVKWNYRKGCNGSKVATRVFFDNLRPTSTTNMYLANQMFNRFEQYLQNKL